MKGSLKKLTVFMTIAAMTIFVVAATASAGDRPGKTIHGVYGWTGPLYCIFTPDGFNENGIPNNPQSLLSSSATVQGTITFNHDGTGKVLFTGVGINPPVNPPPPNYFAGAGLYEASYEHTYNIASNGAITIDAKLNTYVQNFLTGPNKGAVLYIDIWPLTGWISVDHKTITIAGPEPTVTTNTIVLPFPPGFSLTSYSICNASFTLVRIGGHEKDTE